MADEKDEIKSDLLETFEFPYEGKKYKLRYTLQSWRLLKKEGITPTNIDVKMKEDLLETASLILYYGMSRELREKVSIDEFCESIDTKDIAGLKDKNVILNAVKNQLPKAPEGEENNEQAKKKE